MTVHITTPVGELAGREPVWIGPEATLRAVARTLWSESIGALVVGDGCEPLRVITERDVALELAQGADPDIGTARQAMTAYVIAARQTDPIYAAGQMLDDVIRHMPVIDEHDRVVGHGVGAGPAPPAAARRPHRPRRPRRDHGDRRRRHAGADRVVRSRWESSITAGSCEARHSDPTASHQNQP
jgi:CBS-domain-containing membrane protein